MPKIPENHQNKIEEWVFILQLTEILYSFAPPFCWGNIDDSLWSLVGLVFLMKWSEHSLVWSLLINTKLGRAFLHRWIHSFLARLFAGKRCIDTFLPSTIFFAWILQTQQYLWCEGIPEFSNICPDITENRWNRKYYPEVE